MKSEHQDILLSNFKKTATNIQFIFYF